MPKWHKLEDEIRQVFRLYGFAELRTPLVERIDLFVRSIGASTDIVAKELFKIEDARGARLCLRPEGTVPVVRAAAAADMLRARGVSRLWYDGPMFRHERPQQGRLRQFHQFGAEMLGDPSPTADIELLLLCKRLWEKLAIDDKVVLEINNLGTADERAKYRQQLADYFAAHRAGLAATDRRRLVENPLRLLDSKEPRAQELLAAAPVINSCLGAGSRAHLDAVTAALEECGQSYSLNPWLVRGLDYYDLCVFEWTQRGSTKRMNAIAGGGRYDGLLEQLNGQDCPGVGLAAGKERIIALMPEEASREDGLFVGMAAEVFDQSYLVSLCEKLRAEGFAVICHAKPCKIPTLLKQASASIARYAVIVGPRELSEQSLTVKPLRETVDQFTLSFAESVERLRQAQAD